MKAKCPTYCKNWFSALILYKVTTQPPKTALTMVPRVDQMAKNVCTELERTVAGRKGSGRLGQRNRIDDPFFASTFSNIHSNQVSRETKQCISPPNQSNEPMKEKERNGGMTLTDSPRLNACLKEQSNYNNQKLKGAPGIKDGNQQGSGAQPGEPLCLSQPLTLGWCDRGPTFPPCWMVVAGSVGGGMCLLDWGSGP